MSSNPVCEQCGEAEAVVCCSDALFRCGNCCAEDGFDEETGEQGWATDAVDEDDE